MCRPCRARRRRQPRPTPVSGMGRGVEILPAKFKWSNDHLSQVVKSRQKKVIRPLESSVKVKWSNKWSKSSGKTASASSAAPHGPGLSCDFRRRRGSLRCPAPPPSGVNPIPRAVTLATYHEALPGTVTRNRYQGPWPTSAPPPRFIDAPYAAAMAEARDYAVWTSGQTSGQRLRV